MAARSIGSARIAFAFVSIPVKLFTAASQKRPSFNMLHKCGSRLKQVLRCGSEGIEIDRADVVRGFEYEPDKYVRFTDDELAQLKAAVNPDVIAISEFVPEASVDPIYLAKGWLLGPDKGGMRGFRVLSDALTRRRAVGVGKFGDGDLVIVRAVDQGLVLHECFFADEVRSSREIDGLQDPPATSRREVELAERVILSMSKEHFDPFVHANEYARLLRTAVEAKVADKEVLIPPAPKPHQLDLVEALERSLAGPVKAKPRRRTKAA